VLALIKPGDKVLDVGGGAKVFPRANAVVDIIKYEERQPGPLKDMPEQFTKKDWYIGDICAPDVWRNFKDKEFDFVICSHVLEDIRDPIYTCSQLVRVAKSGYIEVPSRFRECAKLHPSDPTPGWDHHRWIVDVDNGTVVFTFKNPWINLFDYASNQRHVLENETDCFTRVHWIGSFDYVENNQKGAPLETENLFLFYENFRSNSGKPLHTIQNVPFRGKTFKWVSEFKLPIEQKLTDEQVLERHAKHLSSVDRSNPKGLLHSLRRKLGV